MTRADVDVRIYNTLVSSITSDSQHKRLRAELEEKDVAPRFKNCDFGLVTRSAVSLKGAPEGRLAPYPRNVADGGAGARCRDLSSEAAPFNPSELPWSVSELDALVDVLDSEAMGRCAAHEARTTYVLVDTDHTIQGHIYVWSQSSSRPPDSLQTRSGVGGSPRQRRFGRVIPSIWAILDPWT